MATGRNAAGSFSIVWDLNVYLQSLTRLCHNCSEPIYRRIYIALSYEAPINGHVTKSQKMTKNAVVTQSE